MKEEVNMNMGEKDEKYFIPKESLVPRLHTTPTEKKRAKAERGENGEKIKVGAKFGGGYCDCRVYRLFKVKS